MAREDQYKLYQLSNIFISKYGFSQIVLDRYRHLSGEEAWLVNYDDPRFNMIRICFDTLSNQYDDERIADYIAMMKERTGKDISFLDIHISREECEESKPYPVSHVEEGFASGHDLHDFYPEIYEAIHPVDNQESEIRDLAIQMRQALIERRRKYLKQRRPLCTYVIITICLALYFITYVLSRTFSFNSVLIFLGANYHTFTLGLKQFYRLILCGFLHGSILHLFTNMYSLYYLGSYCERKYGTVKYLIMLFVSILTGSLSQSIMSGNSLLCGISGAIYAFMIVFILDALKANRMNFYSLIPMILINLSINFISTTAWLAHLGGMISGYLLYLVYQDSYNKGPLFLTVIMIVLLIMKFVTIKTIEPFYPGNDMEVVNMLRHFGFDSYADKLMNRLLQLYSNYGG